MTVFRHNYDPYERPVANSSDPLLVSVKIYLQQILDVDEKNQVITLVAWIEYVSELSVRFWAGSLPQDGHVCQSDEVFWVLVVL